MHLKRFIAAAAALALPIASTAQAPAEPDFSAARFRSHVAFLSDDLLEGRNTGERGYDIAARYVATRFEGLGLQPANKGSWYQQVPFVRYRLGETPARLTIRGKSFENFNDILVGPDPDERNRSVEGPVAFVGYGLDAPEAGFNDYAGLDVKGKIVVVISGTPPGTRSDVAAHLNGEKAAMAGKHGVIGMITVPSRAEQAAWSRPVGAMRPVAMTWIAPNGQPYSTSPGLRFAAVAGPDAAEALFAGASRSLAQVLDEASKPGAKPKGFPLQGSVRLDRATETDKVNSPNVVAMLPGSDPALANEYVLLMAHLDHIGVNPTGQGDRINNGAMDNATGIATMLEVARAMVESGQRPRRPILFAAVTAEEKSLLGAQYLAKNPVVDGKVVGVVNLDMPVLLYDFTDVIAFGAEHSTMGAIVERAGARMGVKLMDDPLPQEGLFTRSDHYRFVQEGIPSVFLMTGFGNGGDQKFRHFLATDYHKPSDEIDQPILWDVGAKFARINYLIAREIADAPEAPRWYRDSFFGTVFAPNQPKARRAQAGE